VAWGARASAASALLLGGALAGAAFGATGGIELSSTTTVEVLAILVAAGVIAAGILYGRSGPLFGATALVLFGALAAYTALAVVWSVVPELTYVEAGRTFAFLALFTAAVTAARLRPNGAPVLLSGILLAATAIVLYALASRIWPGTLAETELSNRIGAPFHYWNAVGAVGAMAAPIALWLGSRRTGSTVLRAAAYPALGVAILAILLTQSRGALLAATGSAALWFLLVPLRLRSLPVLLIPSGAAGAVGAWALSKDAFSKPLQPLAVKESVAGEFGLLVLLLIAVLFAAGLVVAMGMRRGLPPVRAHRRIGLVTIVIACLGPLLLLSSVAFSDRGLQGIVRDRVDQLTSETDTAPAEGSGRIAAASSTRGKYWREAGRVFAEREVVGTGPGTFSVARLRERTDAGVTAHAHGFVPQTLADMGIVGLLLTTALLLAWLLAAGRTTALRPRRRGDARRDWTPDRIALVTLVLVAVAFGIESTLDWTWFIPGVAAMGLLAAGFVAGRGSVGGLAADRVPSRPGAPRIAAAAAAIVLAVLGAWATWQPEASARDSNAALDLIDAHDYKGAEAKAREAARTNPLTPQPLYALALAQASAGDREDSRRTLERAVLRYPGDPETWLRLGHFQLDVLDDPQAALSTVRGALYLDPKSPRGGQLFLAARARSRAQALEKAQRAAGATATPPLAPPGGLPGPAQGSPLASAP
jgi:hypothetical protein